MLSGLWRKYCWFKGNQRSIKVNREERVNYQKFRRILLWINVSIGILIESVVLKYLEDSTELGLNHHENSVAPKTLFFRFMAFTPTEIAVL